MADSVAVSEVADSVADSEVDSEADSEAVVVMAALARCFHRQQRRRVWYRRSMR